MDVTGIGFTVTLHVADWSPAFAVIVAVPIFNPVTLPFASTDATVASLLLQLTVLSVAFAGPTVAVSWALSSNWISSVGWSSEMDVTGIGFTVTLHVADWSPAFAVIVAVPIFNPVTLPFASTDATVASLLLQLTVLSVASSGLTVAVSWALSSSWITSVGWSSDTEVTSTILLETVISQVADWSPAFAVIVAVPGVSAVTLPFASTDATASSLLLQVTVLSVASSGLTVAVSVAFSPSTKDSVLLSSDTDETAIVCFNTVTSQVADWSPAVAVIVAVPGVSAVTFPFASTDATASSLLLQVTVLSVAWSGLTVAFN